MKRYIMIIDVAKCHNCNNCFLACKDEHVGNTWAPISMPQPRHEQKWRQIDVNERGQYPLIDVVYKPGNCMMCENCACIAKGEGAFYRREDGLVLVDNEKAKGRKDLVAACPYHSVWWNEALQLPQKCTFCAHLLDQGWTETRCSHNCPTGATKFLAVHESELAALIENENLQRYHDESGTAPMVFYKNLDKFTKCFISGSLDENGECAEGCLCKAIASDGTETTAVSNGYGDFYIDGLVPGTYSVSISSNGKTKELGNVTITESINLGVINL